MKRVIAAIAGIVIVLLSATACLGDGTSSNPTSQNKESNAQNQDSYNLVNNQPPPVYQYSQERQTLINVEDIQANGENTTSFGISNNGNLVWQCSSIGMPVPADTQLTNPQMNYNSDYPQYGTSYPISQMDPTGVYSGVTTGTNTLCVDSKGQQYIQYWEGYTDAVSGAAVWNSNTHTVTLLGTPDPIKKPPTK